MHLSNSIYINSLNVNLSSICLFLENIELYKFDGPSCLFICGISELHPLVLSLDSELSSIPFIIPLLIDEVKFKSDL